MQAIYITSFVPSASISSLVPRTVPKPKPGPDELLIRITHTSPQQVDLLYAQGKHQNNNAKHGHVHPPFILGLDFVGVVVHVPEHGTAHNPTPAIRNGDRVMGSKLGAFAEYICAKPTEVKRVPAGLSNADAAALVGGATSYGAVMQIAAVRRSETVLVTGVPGGLGVAACQVAKVAGAKVIALASTEAKAEKLRSVLDVDAVFGTDSERWTDRIKKVTAGKGVDVVIDNVGLVEQTLQTLAFGGRIVLVGFAGRKGVMENVGMNKILLKGASIIGYRMGESGRRNPATLAELWTGYLQLLESGAVTPLLDSREYRSVHSIGAALQDLAEGHLFGKAVISIDHGKTASKL